MLVPVMGADIPINIEDTKCPKSSVKHEMEVDLYTPNRRGGRKEINIDTLLLPE
jgi:hypothetical protein